MFAKDYTAGLDMGQRHQIARRLTKWSYLLGALGLDVVKTEAQIRGAFQNVSGGDTPIDMTQLEGRGLRLSKGNRLLIERIEPGIYEVYVQNDADNILNFGPRYGLEREVS
ncbi:hypothetical protein FJZ21_02090 [Candidatus Pacearchaeota archaeon]|nr:hypothetical protein [Candidatus Pacearchaeota archaeon]